MNCIVEELSKVVSESFQTERSKAQKIEGIRGEVNGSADFQERDFKKFNPHRKRPRKPWSATQIQIHALSERDSPNRP